MLQFETMEELSVFSEISNTTVIVRLRRLLNHEPSRFSPAPYCLDLTVGSIVHQYYGIEEQRVREIAIRFLRRGHLTGHINILL